MKSAYVRHVRITSIACVITLSAWRAGPAQGFTAPEGFPSGSVSSAVLPASTDPADYIEVQMGDMPLLLVIGHGGWKVVPPGTENGADSADPILREMVTLIRQRIQERTGLTPYVVYNQANRNYVNPNDFPADETFINSSPLAKDIYRLFHAKVDEMIFDLENQFGPDSGILVDLHTTYLPASRGEKPWDRIAEMGFITSVSDLGSSINTMKALYDRRGEVALRGPDSFPYLLYHAQEWPSAHAVWPYPATVNSKNLAYDGNDVWHVLPAYVNGAWVTAMMNGRAIIKMHGSNASGKSEALAQGWTGTLDAFQFEMEFSSTRGFSLPQDDPRYDPDGPYYQLDPVFASRFCEDFIESILVSLALNYSWDTASTFGDVPLNHPYHDDIEALYQAGYTAGCNTDPLMYCPEATMNRAESAVFVERGIHGTDGLPPQPTTQTFADLPLDSWAAKWAEALWQDHYTAGCGTDPLIYCPWQGHTRAEGCVFYLRMLNGASFEPSQPSQQTFADVPLETWYAKWVQAGYDAGLLEPCQTTPGLRFCPNDPLSRALAAHMMVQAKGLK